LTLKGTSSLDRQQIAGIRHLVSSAIEGLNSNAVTIVDHRGTMLARPNTDGMMTDSYFELQQQYERTLESRIIDLLEPLVGEGKVRTQVSAVMDFSRVELTQRQVDPEKQVVTGENRTQENSTSIDPQAAGVAGAAGNIPPGAAANNAQQQNTRNASSESIQYQTDSSVRQTSLPEGRLERLSVAVAVDGSMIENEAGESIWEALPPETMTKLEELVSKAAGITTSRGDELVVVNTQFQLPAIAAPVEPETPMAPWMRELIQWGALALLLLILVFGVVRPVLNAAKAQTPALVTPEGISFGTELPSESAALPSPAEVVPVGERLRLRAIESTRSNPDRAVQIIRTWLHQED